MRPSITPCMSGTSPRWWARLCNADCLEPRWVVGAAGQTSIAQAVQTTVDGTGSRSPIWSQTRDHPAFLIDNGNAERLFGFAPMEILAALRQFVSDNA